MPADLAETLRTQIHIGQLGPGDRLPNERELATSLGVGRITVREAIRILSGEGYVVSKRGNSGGTYVSDLAQPQRVWLERIKGDPDWITDLIQYRTAVEMRAAELASKRRTATQLSKMQAAIRHGATPSTRSAFRQADHRFHRALGEASGSRRLLNAIMRARGELFVPVDQLTYHDHYTQTRDEHNEIYAAIRDREPEQARKAVQQHLQASLQDFLDMIATPPSTSQE